MQTIGDRIRAKRKELGISQEELADRVFVSVYTLRSYEIHDNMPHVDTAFRLAKELGVTVEWLVEGDKNGTETH